jgi:RND family efflux transporter MFP subunit
MNYNLITCLLIVTMALSSCSNKNNADTAETDSDSALLKEEKAEVKVMVLDFTAFSKEIISNGKLIALQKADLKFRTSENIAVVQVSNGDRVSKGQVLARLDDFSLFNMLKQSRNQFEKAKLELQDILIGQGLSMNDTATISKETLKIARVKSGYDQAFNDLEMAAYNLHAAALKAPFNGVVADLFSKENNGSNVSDKFCTIIDDSRFEAEFAILENELVSVKKGQSVRIIPFAYTDLVVNGKITQINPVVDKNGMVKVKAICGNPDRKLAEGMNVKIIAEDKVPHQLVIPRQALVLRNEKQVVFTLSSGLAKWNYVKTGLENTTALTITEGLSDGDSVIYEGNLNLAHDTQVSIIP